MHAGRIQFFTHNWAQITQDPWVLQTIKGLRLPFTAIPVQEVALAEMRFPGNQINNLFVRPIDYLQLSRDPVGICSRY